MKKLLFTVIVILMAIQSFSQQIVSDSVKITAGDELITASKKFYTGTIISVIGIGIAAIPTKTTDANAINTKTYFGAGIALIGAIVSFSAFSHVSKAGKKLNAYMTQNGFTVGLRF